MKHWFVVLCFFMSGFALAQDATEIPAEATPELSTAQDYLTRANESYTKSEFRFAIADYTSALTLDNTLVEAYVGRAKASAELGLFDASLSDAEFALSVKPDDAVAMALRGYSRLMTNDTENGLADLDKAKQLDLTNPEPYNYLGIYHTYTQEYALALADFNQSLTLNPNQPLTLNSRAVAFYFLGKGGEAFADLNSAIQIAPQIGFLYVNRASFYRAEGNYEQALNNLNQAISVQPSLPIAYLQRAFVYVELGNGGDKSQLAPYYTLALQDLQQYQQVAHPDDINPSVLTYQAQIESVLKP